MSDAFYQVAGCIAFAAMIAAVIVAQLQGRALRAYPAPVTGRVYSPSRSFALPVSASS